MKWLEKVLGRESLLFLFLFVFVFFQSRAVALQLVHAVYDGQVWFMIHFGSRDFCSALTAGRGDQNDMLGTNNNAQC